MINEQTLEGPCIIPVLESDPAIFIIILAVVGVTDVLIVKQGGVHTSRNRPWYIVA